MDINSQNKINNLAVQIMKTEMMNMEEEKICSRCQMCIYGCKNYLPSNEYCEHLTLGMSINELKKEIKIQNVNLRRLAQQHYLKYGKLVDMLRGKMPLHYKYRVAIMNRLNEKPEYDEYIRRFDEEE